jgi:hypothetical protein
MVIEELFEDPELAKLEKYDVLAPLYHVEGIWPAWGVLLDVIITLIHDKSIA